MSVFSEVAVYPSKTPGILLARGSILVGGVMKVNLSLLKGKDGPFVALPQQEGVDAEGKKKYYPHAKLISKEAIAELNALVLAKYEEQKASGTNNSQPVVDDLPF